jgi:phosphate starvation-inducible PhoH-like protein
MNQQNDPITIEFDNNSCLQTVLGPHNSNLKRMELLLNISISHKGNVLVIKGKDPQNTIYAKDALHRLYEKALNKHDITEGSVDAEVKLVSSDVILDESEKNIKIVTKNRVIFPRSSQQAKYIRQIQTNDLVFGLGPAGTGKTYLAAALGVASLIKGDIKRLILTRPAVEAGEKLGFLPGNMMEKVDPYLRPIYDALHDMMSAEQVKKHMLNGDIEVAPLAFMRGRTLSDAFVILDEAQNTTLGQMKMFLTRLGNRSQMVVTGDLSQVDLPPGMPSGLQDAVNVLESTSGIGMTTFDERDVVRHPLVAKIVKAYNSRRG